MAFLGYAAMVALGAVLGLIGAGGSILTVPILVYLLDVAPTAATGYSLAIVGTTALAGAVAYVRRGQADLRMALGFGAPAVASVYFTRTVLFPAIPDPVVQIGRTALSKDLAVMGLFASLMTFMAISMIRSSRKADGEQEPRSVDRSWPLLVALGALVGVVTGLVGAGGGFMILPVLVLYGGLPMKVAIGTDLLVIAAKSLVGFAGELQVSNSMDLSFVAAIVALPLAGIVVGTRLNRIVSAERLQAGFGWFVLTMAIVIVVTETLGA